MPHASGLSRQDTLPAEDPSWSYPLVPGQVAPIPPRNEPLLFIFNHTAHHDANASCSKNFPLSAANSEGNPRIETLKSSFTHTSNPTHAALNLYQVCSPLIQFHILIVFHYTKGARAAFWLDWRYPPVGGNGFIDRQ